MEAAHRAKRDPSANWPMVFYRCGMWMRSGHPSRYDAYPVMAERQPPWHQKLAATVGPAR